MSKESSIDSSDTVAETPSTGASMATAAAVLGADLVVVALAWDSPPNEGGIVTITFLMLISFVVFLNELHMMMRYEYLVSQLKSKGMDEKVREKDSREIYQIGKWVRYYQQQGYFLRQLHFGLSVTSI